MTREIPIIFSAPMVRAILAGGKTQTRRVIKDQALYRDDGTAWTGFMGWQPLDWALANPGACGKGCLPRWRVADHLWVKETLTARPLANFLTGEPTKAIVAAYAADDEDVVEQAGFNLAPWWRGGEDRRASLPSIFMPRHASRITLEVTAVRVERLQDISEDDAIAEGAFKGKATGRIFNNVTEMRLGGPEWRNARDWYADLWETINGAGSWQANPWVTALTFRRLEAADAS